ncbi:hypothetical protein [Geomicrobium sp. JCM 19039]|uniref:hypothetical protein n=1 Tax=Geomicrobium sp. JCM 19039 TaxID=1460636 RepID=UPI00045F2706|nr:hypothetical protein [Geomicrobium sp. JCM 19039]GAK12443.1 hypothetical protein JCM19039_2217 [Geomicrobium sp. JCM 19039]
MNNLQAVFLIEAVRLRVPVISLAQKILTGFFSVEVVKNCKIATYTSPFTNQHRISTEKATVMNLKKAFREMGFVDSLICPCSPAN